MGKGLYRGVIGVIEALYLGDPDGNGLELYPKNGNG
jgi:catechol-2,3-dioxygenase